MELYQESRIFPIDDYMALLEAAKGCKAALEFGPGFSTYALIEAGCDIFSYEHNNQWLAESRKIFKPFQQVKIYKYQNTPKITLRMPVDRFDIAFVDSPVGGRGKSRIIHPNQEGCSRMNTLKFALDNADIVLMHDCEREDERNSIKALGAKFKMLSTKVARVWI